jgi:hypothetical protein
MRPERQQKWRWFPVLRTAFVRFGGELGATATATATAGGACTAMDDVARKDVAGDLEIKL